MRWTIPNILTVGRVLAAPLIAIIFLVCARPMADWIAFVLFVGAALTDFVDGWIARAWNQGSAFGKMLDPIADKAIVVIALATLFALIGMNPFFVIPAAVILLREVLVSGLREYLGAVKLDVTQIAKWKTTVQMVAISTLLLAGGFTAMEAQLRISLSPDEYQGILDGQIPDRHWLLPAYLLGLWGHLLGLIILWIAAILTAWSGLDYFRKAMPYLAAKDAS